MRMRRGTNLVNIINGEVMIVLGPQDFKGYDYNRPLGNWELCWSDRDQDDMTWVPMNEHIRILTQE